MYGRLMRFPHKARYSALQLVLGVFAFAANSLVHADAATVQTSKNPNCAFSLEGPIVSGDSAALLALISTSRLDSLDERTTSICLRSNGGSYAEGLKISELLFSRGMSTVIEDGSECYSACAIIFMAGVTSDQEIPYRKLSVGGSLGFHAPYLNLPEASYSKAEVDSTAQRMRAAILALMQLSSKKTKLHGGDFIKRAFSPESWKRGRRRFSSSNPFMTLPVGISNFTMQTDILESRAT
ncbi:hypothetical protein [Bradyrhizobium sp. LB13.1]